MRLRTKIVVIGATTAAVVAGVAVARVVRRRRKRVLDRKMRKVMADLIELRGEDFVAGEVGKSLFRTHIDKLSTPQLAVLCALVEVGYFIKVSGIDPLHPDRNQITQAVRKYLSEYDAVPVVRDELLSQLDSSDSRDALISAFRVLADARI